MAGRVGFVAALFLARMAFGFQFQAVANLAPELVARFGLDYTALGTLLGAYMLPGIVVALPGGLLGRRVGPWRVVVAGLGLMMLGGALPAVWFTPGGIWTGRVLAGAGAVALVVLQGKMVSDRFEGPAFITVMGALVGAFPIGVGLVGVAHDVVGAALGPTGLFVVGSGLAALALGAFVVSVGAEARVVGALSWPSWRECRLVVVAGLTWTFYNAGYYGFLSYMPSLLAARGHGPGLVATVLAVATWSNLPATLLGGAVAARVGHGPVMLAGTLCCAAGVAGPAVADWPVAWALLFGLGGSMHAGVIVAVGTLSARPENRALGMGLFYTTYYVGGTVLPSVFGAAADRVGTPAGAMVAASAVSLLTVAAYAWHQRLAQTA